MHGDIYICYICYRRESDYVSWKSDCDVKGKRKRGLPEKSKMEVENESRLAWLK